MRRSQILRTPPQGWSTLAGFLLLLAVVGLAITNAHPLIPTDRDQPWTLAGIMVTSGLVGFVLARSSIGLVRSHVIGAAAGAFILILVVAASVEGGTSGPLLLWLLEPELLSMRLAGLWSEVQSSIDAGSSVAAVSDTQAAGMLILGAICWTTGQFGASSIFRFDRGVPAVAAAGILLLLSIALPPTPGAQPVSVVFVLALFTAFAMLTLVRMQLSQQRTGWVRRHIADTGEVSRLFLRTGAFFVIFSVVGASTLTLATENTVVEGPWEDWDGQLPGISDELERILSWFAIRPDPEQQPTFGGKAPVGEEWKKRPGNAFVVTDADMLGNYWWGAAWDSFDGKAWYNSDETDRDVAAGGSLRPLPRDTGGTRFRTRATIKVDVPSLAQTSTFSASEPESVSVDVDNVTIGRGGSRARTDFDRPLGSGDEYTVQSLALDYVDTTGSTGLTKRALRAIPIRYPKEFRERYASVEPGSIGQITIDKAREFKDQAIADGEFNAWDVAKAIETWLQSDEFSYNASMSAHLRDGCRGLTTPDCVLTVREGFCTYYASTMAMLLREMGIATRLVWGYLPGEENDGTIVVQAQALHAWPEVYFAGFGWVRFDPTPLGRFGQTLFEPAPDSPQGSDATEEPSPGPTLGPAIETPQPTEGAVITGPDGPETPTSSGIEFPLFVMLAAAVSFLLLAVVATVRLRRLPRADAGLAYRGIVSLATKLGYGPHPAQTELEYAATLSDTIPSVQQELYVVANAKVESSYAEVEPPDRDKGALRRAYARIRTALFRLSLRGKR